RKRFGIMKQVGMDDQEIRETIKRQVLMVFFLPLGLAALHSAAAFTILCKLLRIFDMTNTMLFAVDTLLSILIFAVLYFIVYKLTERTYYKIVQKQ
ncbi:MAG: ABC transporter permease, partial [Eubacterium sp.]